ncbi:MAG TPA: HAD family hydrolase [Terracidiphilus sp.]|nr:HAD family hydrolase [Terracidiphilus sp.]
MASSISASPVQITCKGVLFDMDGILISSLGSVVRSWTKWALMRGLDPEETLKIVHGRRSIETVAKLRPDLDAEAENRIIEQLEIDDTEGIEALPGAISFLQSLPRNRWTVVTSATSPLARIRLESAGIPLPESYVTADSVTQGKPHPAPYLAGAALLGVAPEECVVFEDATSGVKAGRAAGSTVIATPFSHPIEALRDANYLVPDLAAVTAEVIGDSIALKFVPLAV